MIERPKDWWLKKALAEPEVPISAGVCRHEDFHALELKAGP